MKSERTAYIVGAGFSANAGLPLQSGFTETFLKAERYKKGKSRELMPPLKKFVNDTFGFGSDVDQSLYPQLEDLFTTLDLSANSGHHLGRGYAPSDLRRLRRILLSRIIRMLHTEFLSNLISEKRTPSFARLVQFLNQVSEMKHCFVSLNWDAVIEGCLDHIQSPLDPYYSPEIYPAEIKDGIIIPRKRSERRLLLAKMHGSINWLYCDCCRRSFSVPLHSIGSLATQVLKGDEIKTLYGEEVTSRLRCPYCEVDLSVRLATFSYQKALRAPLFETSWMEAEKALRDSRRWVFIGYSLPAADFEFKCLLKRVELARKQQPEIVVVTKRSDSDPPDMTQAQRSYIQFFGQKRLKFFTRGLTEAAVSKIL
jgi:hypothetical protein